MDFLINSVLSFFSTFFSVILMKTLYLLILLVFVAACTPSTQIGDETGSPDTMGTQDNTGTDSENDLANGPDAVDNSGIDNSGTEGTDNPGTDNPGVPPLPPVSQEEIDAALAGRLSSADLASHDSAGDCWVGFRGKAYDVTSFLPRHEGGVEAISPYCGKSTEFEDAFITKHGETKVQKMIDESVLKGNLV